MAKRYIKIGWENKPSVKTPVNMANLGRMDKGIDDCDNAIEEIYSKRVNNVVTTNEDTFLAGPVGKVLQDQVTELNNNLDNMKTQEDWITAPLQNGWTGTLQYARNGLKQVTLKGIIKGGALTPLTLIATLPVGYRPSNNTPIYMQESPDGFVKNKALYLATNGGLYVPKEMVLEVVNYNFQFLFYAG